MLLPVYWNLEVIVLSLGKLATKNNLLQQEYLLHRKLATNFNSLHSNSLHKIFVTKILATKTNL
jgi:hypothetical protein